MLKSCRSYFLAVLLLCTALMNILLPSSDKEDQLIFALQLQPNSWPGPSYMPPACSPLQQHDLPLRDITDNNLRQSCESETDVQLVVVQVDIRRRCHSSYGEDVRLIFTSHSKATPATPCAGDHYAVKLTSNSIDHFAYSHAGPLDESRDLLPDESAWPEWPQVVLGHTGCSGYYSVLFRDVQVDLATMFLQVERLNRRWKHYLVGMYPEFCGWCKMKPVSFWTDMNATFEKEMDCDHAPPEMFTLRTTVYRIEVLWSRIPLLELPLAKRSMEAYFARPNRCHPFPPSLPLCSQVLNYRGRWVGPSCLQADPPCIDHAPVVKDDAYEHYRSRLILETSDYQFVPFNCQDRFLHPAELQAFLLQNKIFNIAFFGDSVTLNLQSEFALAINRVTFHSINITGFKFYGTVPLPTTYCSAADRGLYSIKSKLRTRERDYDLILTNEAMQATILQADLLVAGFSFAHDESGIFSKRTMYFQMRRFFSLLLENQFAGAVVVVLPLFPGLQTKGPVWDLMSALTTDMVATVRQDPRRRFRILEMDQQDVTKGRPDRFVDRRIHYYNATTGFRHTLGQALARKLFNTLFYLYQTEDL